MAPLNVNKAACLKPVLGEMERKLIIVCILMKLVISLNNM